MICAKIQPQGILRSKEGFLKVFTIYGHGGHLGQWTVTILAIFCSPVAEDSEDTAEKSFEILTIFPFKCMGLIQMHREANLTLP